MYRKMAGPYTLFLIFVACAVFYGQSAFAAPQPAVLPSNQAAAGEQPAGDYAGTISSASDLDALLTSSLQSLFAPGQWKAPYIQIDGRQIPLDAQPVLKDGVVWASYASMLSALGLDSVNGVNPSTVNGCTMVGLRSLCETLGYSINYDAGTQRVLIATGEEMLSSGNTGSIQWDGGEYKGGLKAGVPDGQGTLTWSDGTVYTGEFRAGSMTGQGALTCPEGFTYEGDFIDGLFNGYGVWTDSSGVSYEGQWLDGRQNGWGTMTYANGARWQGTFENGYRINGQFIS